MIRVVEIMEAAEKQTLFLKRRRFCWPEWELQLLSSFYSLQITLPARAKLQVTGHRKIEGG
jgi:hypothetical protein